MKRIISIPVRGVRLAVALVLVLGLGATGSSLPLHADEAAIRAVNSEFYRAFRESDLAAMDAVWGHKGKIAVEHPSGWRLEGRAAVMQSWAAIMRAPPNITCVVQSVVVTGNRAVVVCEEHLNPGTVTMQNVFHTEGGAWKMIYHGPLDGQVS